VPRRRPPATIVLKTESEKSFQEKVKKIAHLYGWCGFHIHFSQGAVTGVHTLGLGDDHYDSNGFPDWVFWHADRGVIFRELKAYRGYLSAEQRATHERMRAAGLDVDVWKPGDEQKVIKTFRGVT
jgi:hypothetical protein